MLMVGPMFEKVLKADGFIAALDQSGGSTPKALRLYGISDDSYVEGEKSMFDKVHEMRTRIITSKAFDGDRILGAILFEDTMDRDIEGQSTGNYLWQKRNIVPFLKIDKGLASEASGVQLMKPIPGLDELLKRGKGNGMFGTKMRSVIKKANAEGIKAIVDQQFELAKEIIAAELIPIIEPEVDIHSEEKEECETILKKCILEHLDQLKSSDMVMLKLTLPSQQNLYKECIDHPQCMRVVALSGGYERERANEILSQQKGMIASFSRALTQDIKHGMTEDEFDEKLDQAIDSIYKASKAG
jgi:fructose-bisphosphate aldolase class I